MGAILYKDKVYGVGGSIIEGYYKVTDRKFYEEHDGCRSEKTA